MPIQTPNLALKKPQPNETADIAAINENMDIIDTVVAGHTSAIAPHSGHETPAGAQAKVNAHAALAAPHTGHETPAGAQARVDTHAVGTAVHGATSAPTANLLVLRDAAGRAQVAAPSVAADIARLDTVTNHANLTNNMHGLTLSTGDARGIRNITASTAAPSGGSDGDVWLRYT